MNFKYKIYPLMELYDIRNSLGFSKTATKEFKADLARRIRLINKYLKNKEMSNYKEQLIQLKVDLMNLI